LAQYVAKHADSPNATTIPNNKQRFTVSVKYPTRRATGPPTTKNPKAMYPPNFSSLSLSVNPKSFAIADKLGASRF
jgi:hypothetical protein